MSDSSSFEIESILLQLFRRIYSSFIFKLFNGGGRLVKMKAIDIRKDPYGSAFASVLIFLSLLFSLAKVAGA